jgi:hypothetical protein
MLERAAVAALAFVFLAVVYGALEHAFPARRARRWRDADFLADCCFFLGQSLGARLPSPCFPRSMAS